MAHRLWSRLAHVFGVHHFHMVDITADGMLVYQCRWCCAETLAPPPPE